MNHMERQTRVAKRPATDESQAEAVVCDARDEQLDSDVSCCLAEIDSVLAEAEAEKQTAVSEFEDIAGRYRDLRISEGRASSELAVWTAKYAHLGLGVRWCCGMPRMTASSDG